MQLKPVFPKYKPGFNLRKVVKEKNQEIQVGNDQCADFEILIGDHANKSVKKKQIENVLLSHLRLNFWLWRWQQSVVYG